MTINIKSSGSLNIKSGGQMVIAGGDVAVTPVVGLTLRLTSTSINGSSITYDNSNSWNGAVDAAQWVGNGWYRSGLVWRNAYVPVGCSMNLTYRAVNPDSTPISGATVHLKINKQYSNSNAHMQFGAGQDIPALAGEVTVSAVTDGSGYVTFSLYNLNSSGEVSSAPVDFTAFDNRSPKAFSQIAPYLLGGNDDAIDIYDFVFYHN